MSIPHGIAPKSDKYEVYEMAVNAKKFIAIPRGVKRHSVMRAIHSHAERYGKKFVCRTPKGRVKPDGIWVFRQS